MFLRSAPTLTLPDVRERLGVSGETISARSSEIEVVLTADAPAIRVKNREVPATPEGIKALASRLDVPVKFLTDRCPTELQQTILNQMLRTQAAADTHYVRLSDTAGVLDVRAENAKVIDPRRFVDIASNVISPDATVLDFWNEPSREFRLDVMVPVGFDTGWGGDRRVGDLTGAGLRFTQNLTNSSQFYAPQVSLLLYRLACTNGYERLDVRPAPDARGKSVDEVLLEFEAMADAAFRRAEEEINAFYEMRSTPVENPEQAIIRLGREQDMPRSLVLNLVERVPTIEATGPDGSVSMFDVVNLVTNAANDPAVRRAGSRRILERVGGNLIGEHAERCAHCQAKLN